MQKKRPTCTYCTRPVSHCLCRHISKIANHTQVLVLQHPNESKHPLNTARLAVLGLKQSQLWVGEHFAQLDDRLATVETAFLLFPANEHSLIQPLAALDKESSSLLIVPDGTWRNVRKIIGLNPVLSTLPHLSLPLGQPSQYRVRKTSETAAVSTIEAITRALTFLEPGQDFAPLLTPFSLMIEQQIQAMGAQVYARNYLPCPNS